MEKVKLVIYGIIVGNWLMGIRRRLMSVKIAGRYAVTAESVVIPDLRTIVGWCDTMQEAEEACKAVEDSEYFNGGIYDRMEKDNARFLAGEFEPFTKWEDLLSDDKVDLRRARELCTVN